MAWKWIVRRTKESKPFFFAFATICGVVPGVIGYCVMQVTNTRTDNLESHLRRNARPDSLISYWDLSVIILNIDNRQDWFLIEIEQQFSFEMMGQVNKERLAEYLGELQRKENTNDRYVAALRGETLTRKPYVRIQPVPEKTDTSVEEQKK
ncbi:hypothetical protein Lal_00034207 [Lupinus albus]|nr:hypothetical protein Lal_00034207 [Lupinus albus]